VLLYIIRFTSIGRQTSIAIVSTPHFIYIPRQIYKKKTPYYNHNWVAHTFKGFKAIRAQLSSHVQSSQMVIFNERCNYPPYDSFHHSCTLRCTFLTKYVHHHYMSGRIETMMEIEWCTFTFNSKLSTPNFPMNIQWIYLQNDNSIQLLEVYSFSKKNRCNEYTSKMIIQLLPMYVQKA